MPGNEEEHDYIESFVIKFTACPEYDYTESFVIKFTECPILSGWGRVYPWV